MTDNRDALVGRLRAMEDSGKRTAGGGICGIRDGKPYSETWDNEPIMRLRNPDGPAAADLIEALATQVQPAAPVLTETGVGFKVGEALRILDDMQMAADKLAVMTIIDAEERRRWEAVSNDLLAVRVALAQPPAAAGDESSITNAEIDKAVRHGFGDRTADAVAAEPVEREGWVLVPRVPTQEMVDAAVVPLNRTGSVRRVWSAMIAAAPASRGSHE